MRRRLARFRNVTSRKRSRIRSAKRANNATKRFRMAALTNTHLGLLYCAMLVASSGNTALQSVMPAIGREIGIGDFYVAIAYTWSAVLWVLLVPNWAEKSDHHG